MAVRKIISILLAFLFFNLVWVNQQVSRLLPKFHSLDWREQDLERFRKVAQLLDLFNHIHFVLQLRSGFDKGFLLAALAPAGSAAG